MEISEIRVFLKEGQDKKLKAYTTVTFDNVFVVRNIKVIQGSDGYFIAMPSRKLKSPCQKCNTKNEYGSNYCSKCGTQLPANAVAEDDEYGGDAKSQHRDIAHPITKEFREYLQKQILEAYTKEVGQSSSADTSEKALSGSNF